MKRLLFIILLFPVGVAGQETSVRIADGADKNVGKTTDSAVTGDNSGSISAKIRGLSKMWFSVWDSNNNRLNVNLTNSSIAAAQSGTWTVSVSNFPASQAVTGTFWQATQPVSGTFWQATQPVSGPLTDTQLRASAVPVSGTVTANAGTNLNTSALALDATLTGGTQKTKLVDTGGTNVASVSAVGALKVDNSAVTQPVSGTISIGNTITTKADTIANQTNPLVVTLGNTVGKTSVLKTGTLASSATTADQVVLTYTVTAGKTLYLQTWDVSMGLTTPGTTAIGGSCSLESPAGTKLDTNVFRSIGHQAYISQNYAEPIGISAGTVIRFVCTPAVVTATTWAASLAGYER